MTDRARGPAFDARSILAKDSRDTTRLVNRRRLIRAVMVVPDSQAGLVRRTHLSPATVSTAVNELLEEGVLIAESGNGERGKRLRLGPIRGVAVGVEVNHSNVLVAARSVASPEVEYASIEFSPDQAGNVWARHAVQLVEEAVTRTGLTKDDIVSIGVGFPASIDPRTSKFTQVPSSQGWHLTKDPREQFMQNFPTAQVIVDNEANFAAYGEIVHGAGRSDHETMLFVKAATEIGAGLIIGGVVYRGRHGIAGEIGHLAMVPLEGIMCRCGNRGCLETLIGGNRLLKEVRLGYSPYRIDPPTTLESMIERAKGGDPVCRRVLLDAARVLGLALAKVCNVVNPELVVLGGEWGLAADLLLTTVRDAMQLHALRGMFAPEPAPVQVVGSELGRQAGIRGALSFALQIDEVYPEQPRTSTR